MAPCPRRSRCSSRVARVRVTPSSLGRKFSVSMATRMGHLPCSHHESATASLRTIDDFVKPVRSLFTADTLPIRAASLSVSQSLFAAIAVSIVYYEGDLHRNLISRSRGRCGAEEAMMSPANGMPNATAQLADRYRVLARVGLGGTAVVYRAMDLHTERIVAVKGLRTNSPLIPVASTRFRREAYLPGSPSHPHIVRGLGFGFPIPCAPWHLVPWRTDADPPWT